MTHWRVLAAVGTMTWGTYFIYDIPAPLSIPISEHLSFSDHQTAYLVSLLYTVYSAPSIVLPFLSGTALLFALAVQTRFKIGMIVGRAFIGLGGEVVGVLGCEIITRWFQYKSLSLALAINLGLGRLGSVSNSVVIPRLIKAYGIVSATWIATTLSLGIPTIGLIYFLTLPVPAEDDALPINESGSTKPVASFPLHVFPAVFWQLALICLLGYGCLNTLTNSAQRFLAVRFYQGDQPAAGSAISILFVLSGCLVPPFGFLIDSLQSRGYPRALITSNVLLILAHGIFLARSAAIYSPIVPLCLLGVADALLNVAFWGSVTRCLLHTVTAIRTNPPRMNDSDNTNRKDEYEPLLSARGVRSISDCDLNSEEGESGGATETNSSIHGEAIRTLGLGIMTSLVNISTAVVPVFLVVVEDAAGFQGLEAVFLVLGVLGCLGSVRLVWMWEDDEEEEV